MKNEIKSVLTFNLLIYRIYFWGEIYYYFCDKLTRELTSKKILKISGNFTNLSFLTFVNSFMRKIKTIAWVILYFIKCQYVNPVIKK